MADNLKSRRKRGGMKEKPMMPGMPMMKMGAGMPMDMDEGAEEASPKRKGKKGKKRGRR